MTIIWLTLITRKLVICLTHRGRERMPFIFQTTFTNYSMHSNCRISIEILLKFFPSDFICSRNDFAKQSTSHYLNQSWSLLTLIFIIRPRWVNFVMYFEKCMHQCGYFLSNIDTGSGIILHYKNSAFLNTSLTPTSYDTREPGRLNFTSACGSVDELASVIWLAHYSDVIMGAMASQIISVSIVQAQINENIQASRHWPL